MQDESGRIGEGGERVNGMNARWTCRRRVATAIRHAIVTMASAPNRIEFGIAAVKAQLDALDASIRGCQVGAEGFSLLGPES
jgi:hypothetical protein